MAGSKLALTLAQRSPITPRPLGGRFTVEMLRRAIWAGNALFLAVCAVLAYGLWRHSAEARPPTLPPHLSASGAAWEPPKKLEDFRHTWELALRPPRRTEPRPAPPMKPPAEALDALRKVRLVAVLLDSNAAKSQAALQMPGSADQELVVAGSTVGAFRAKVLAVERDAVVVELGGARYRLGLGGAIEEIAAAAPAPEHPRQPEPVVPAGGAPMVPAHEGTQLLRSQGGYLVVLPGTLSRWSARPGDIVVRVGFQPALDFPDAPALLSRLAKRPDLVLGVLRGPEALTLRSSDAR